jgi:hypothetical protein
LFKISSNLMSFEQGNVNKEEVKDIWRFYIIIKF